MLQGRQALSAAQQDPLCSAGSDTAYGQWLGWPGKATGWEGEEIETAGGMARGDVSMLRRVKGEHTRGLEQATGRQDTNPKKVINSAAVIMTGVLESESDFPLMLTTQ